jgi:membrane protease YdiL (CAAX protease family)
MQQPEKFVWITILVVELTFMVLTRFVVARFPAFSVDAELIRTVLRLAAVLLYLRLVPELISLKYSATGLREPALLLSFLLFLSVPLLVSDASFLPPITRAVYAVTSIAVALKEEISYRALIQNLLARRWGSFIAVPVASLLFLASHVGVIPLFWWAYAQVAIAGLLLGIVYARTQNLWLVICLHTVFDAIWSATPVFSPPFPYSVGVFVLIASSLLAMSGAGSSFKRV